MKRRLHFCIIFCLAVGMVSSLWSCTSSDSSVQNSSQPSALAFDSGSASSDEAQSGTNIAEDKLVVCTTFFPIYDMTRNIVGTDNDSVEVILINDAGEDYHTFEPSEEDLEQIRNSDIFIFVGGVSEEWALDLADQYLAELEADENAPVPFVVNLLMNLQDGILKLEPEVSEYDDVQTEHLYGHEVSIYDEHIWLSLIHAYDICGTIKDALLMIDEEHEDVYAQNATVYMDALKDLSDLYLTVTDEGEQEAIIIADRNPFRYLMSAYLLESYPLIDNCPALATDEGTNHDIVKEETLNEIVALMEQNKILKVIVDNDARDEVYKVLTGRFSDRAIELVAFYSMHAISLEQVNDGVTYISLMEQNLELLKHILR